ncbi:carboxypeptidase-like regulatory domain-containing protein [Salinimicrobium flavum]|uniref:Carboxypeptidase-like regulatory domain-containing protein n=1 Tax=Salinimicrobium flavum TaxID=1737065 RepID=A0ABW5J042_9FLAO
MKYLLFILCSLFLQNLQAQERLQMEGMVKANNSPLENVHVKNVSTGKFSVSNHSGQFILKLKAGDTLVLSHVGMNDLINFVGKRDLQGPLIFNMTENTSELREVVVNETSEINAVSLGIIPKKIEKLSVNERRLKTAGDFKPIHLLGLLVGSLKIDPILNAINGRTKRLKRNITFEQKEKHISFLENHYYIYMQKKMHLTEHEIRLLINRVIEEDHLGAVIETNNSSQIEFFLEDQWIKFKDDLESSENL